MSRKQTRRSILQTPDADDGMAHLVTFNQSVDDFKHSRQVDEPADTCRPNELPFGTALHCAVSQPCRSVGWSEHLCHDKKIKQPLANKQRSVNHYILYVSALQAPIWINHHTDDSQQHNTSSMLFTPSARKPRMSGWCAHVVPQHWLVKLPQNCHVLT